MPTHYDNNNGLDRIYVSPDGKIAEISEFKVVADFDGDFTKALKQINGKPKRIQFSSSKGVLGKEKAKNLIVELIKRKHSNYQPLLDKFLNKRLKNDIYLYGKQGSFEYAAAQAVKTDG